MELKGFKLSNIKIDYLECKFNIVEHEMDGEVRLDTQVIARRGSCQVSGGIYLMQWEIDDDVTYRV